MRRRADRRVAVGIEGRTMRVRGSPNAVSVMTLVLCRALSAHALERPATTERFLELPGGTTPVAEIGVYTVGYRYYGRDAVLMPPSWSGDFSGDAGIAYQPVRHGNRPAALLHCPWRGGTGAAFAEYRLRLPRTDPTVLCFGIAMRPDTVDKSDGVTFSVTISSGGEREELVREHYARAEPREFRFDLGRFAGRDVVLRFQAEPGPENSPSFDFSRFVDARLTVGAPTRARSALAKALTATKAYRVLRRGDLRALANRSGEGVTPSCMVAHSNRVTETAGGYELSYDGQDCRMVYRLPLEDGTPDGITAAVDGGEAFLPCAGAGIHLAVDGRAAPPQRSRVLSHRRVGEVVEVTARYEADAAAANVQWRYRIRGKALLVEASSSDETIARFSLGRAVAEFRKVIPIPYLHFESACYLARQRVFVMGYIDWTRSHASSSPGRESVYVRKLDGRRNALAEAGYVAASAELGEVLPNIPHPPSPYRSLLGPKMMLDVWGGRFEHDARLLERYKRHGIDELAIIKHVWQRYGYDVKLPDHLPANPQLGGDEGMRRLAGTAARLGYVFSLHENYIDFYPDAPSYDERDVVRTPAGTLSKAWFHKGTKVQSFAMKANRMLHYAAQNSPEIHARFGTTASYLDVHTCVAPWHHVDYEAGQDRAGMYAAKVDHHARLFEFERRTHAGPLFGEGARHFFWAGLVDGVEAQVAGGEDHAVLVDFDLLKLHPQMVNHGMGYYARWLRTGKESTHGVDWPTPLQLDRCRAQELAYGHAAFVGSGLLDVMPAVVREYHLVQPVGRLYGEAKVTEIFWECDGDFVSSSVAAAVGGLSRLRVRYDSGLSLHVNLDANEDWRVGDRVLPPWGFVAEGPETLVYTARRDGVIADFAKAAGSLYVDARTEIYRPWEYGSTDVEPRVRQFRALDGGRFEITYEWRVGDTLEDDYRCFVHFCDPAGEIVFQNDHVLPAPTSSWRRGSIVTDGPHALEVPLGASGDRFDILIGLHKGGRVKLAGVPAGANRFLIGRLAVGRRDGRLTGLRLEGIDELRGAIERRRAAFLDRMNVARARVDFGVARTDGAFKVSQDGNRLVLIPLTRGRRFEVEVDLRGLATGPFGDRPRVVALGEDGEDRGAVRSRLSGSWLAFTAVQPGAARYLIWY